MSLRAARALGAGLALAALAPGALAGDRVEHEERLAVDGAELYLLVRGADACAPRLLWLHGGPGGAERPLFRHFNGELEEHFVVSYWDQRGAGRSFDPDADPSQLSVSRHLADLSALVTHLRTGSDFRFSDCQILEPETAGAAPRLVLVGHSWGGALALLYARDHPADVAAVLAVAPLVAPRASQEAEFDFVLAEAVRREDEDALAKLREVGAPPWASAEKALAVERIANDYGAVYHAPPSRAWTVLRAIVGGLVTPLEIARIIRGNETSLDAMYEELGTLDLRASVPRLEVPVVFLLGRHDRHVDSRIAAAYFEGLEAPSKQLVWFEGSAHNPPFEEPERFDQAVVDTLARLGIGR